MPPVKHERLEAILTVVQRNGKATVDELSSQFKVSEITVRRDLKELERQGMLRRVHGGVVYRIETPPEPSVMHRQEQQREAKERIAQVTATLIDNNDTVFIGAGTTAMYVARCLKDYQNLTVVTNAISIVNELATANNVTIVILGGVLLSSEMETVGHITEQALREVRIDKAVIGMRAISIRDGLTTDFMPEISTQRAIINMSTRLIVVADHTKFDKSASAYVAPISDIDTLVTDHEADASILEAIRKQAVEVIVT